MRRSVPWTETFTAKVTGLSSTKVPGNTLIVSPGNASAAAAFIVLFESLSIKPVFVSLPK